MAEKRQFFSNKPGFMIAAIAMAVGTGNIRRFPRMAVAKGGPLCMRLILDTPFQKL